MAVAGCISGKNGPRSGRFSPSAPQARQLPGTSTARRQAGLSIVELMVGLVVSMLVALAAASSAMMFGVTQRQGIGIGGNGIQAASVLAALKNDAAQAGLGFFGDSRYLCDRLSLNRGSTVISNGDVFTPVLITRGVDDTVDVVYGDRIESGATVLLAADSDGSSAELLSLLPVSEGQDVLLAPATPGAPCLVRTVTAVTASTAATPQALQFDPGGTYNPPAGSTTGPVLITGPKPKPKAMPTPTPTPTPTAAFAERDHITVIGSLQWNRYRREGNTLVLDRPLTGDSVVLARDVIAFRAQYGVADPAAGGTTLAQWVDASGAFAALDASTLPRVRAIRMGLVTRSPQPDKPTSKRGCDTSPTKPQLFGVEVTPDVADWPCWRYRVATVVVPLRNLVQGFQ